MGIDLATAKRKLFLSYRKGLDTDAWVSLAAKQLKDYYEVYNYQELKDISAANVRISSALIEKINLTDVVICLIDSEYSRQEYTLLELKTALRRATGSDSGTLAQQSRRPLIFVMAMDDFAADWLRTNHKDFPHLVFDDYQFRDKSDVPVDGRLWEQLRDNIDRRLRELDQDERSGNQASPASTITENPPDFAIFGRPNAAFGAEITQACKEAVSELGDTLNLGAIPDGWADRDGSNSNANDSQTSQVLLGIAKGGPRSVLVQPCDLSVLEDVRDDDQGALGDGFKRHLKKIRSSDGNKIAEDDVKVAIARTLFWVPRLGEVNVAPIEGSNPTKSVPSLADIKPGSEGGPWLRSSTPRVLATWIQLRASSPSLKVKTEEYNTEIAPKLETGLQKSYPNPVNLTMIPIDLIPSAIDVALKEGSKIIVAVFDNEVRVNQSVLDIIKVKIKKIDQQIYNMVGDTSGRGVARAVFLLRFPTKVPDSIIPGMGKNWILVPLDRSFTPSEGRIKLINDELNR